MYNLYIYIYTYVYINIHTYAHTHAVPPKKNEQISMCSQSLESIWLRASIRTRNTIHMDGPKKHIHGMSMISITWDPTRGTRRKTRSPRSTLGASSQRQWLCSRPSWASLRGAPVKIDWRHFRHVGKFKNTWKAFVRLRAMQNIMKTFRIVIAEMQWWQNSMHQQRTYADEATCPAY